AYMPASLQIPFLTIGLEESLGASFTPSDCCQVTASTAGTKLTVETSDVEMVWDTTFGAGLSELYTEEEANATTNRRGDSARYNVATTQIHDGTWHFERDAPGTLEVVEVTAARVKLRQLYDFTGQIHQDRTWAIYSHPRLAVEDTEIFDVGFNMRRAGGLHPKGEATCASQTNGSTFYCAGRSDQANRVWLVTDDDNTYGDMLMLGEFDLCSGRGAAGCIYEEGPEAGTPGTYFARIHESTPAFVSAGTYTNRFLFYPRLEGLTSAGTEWQPYANDHRNPHDPSGTVAGGTGWFDANELTSSPSDFYNEAEAAYLFDMNPAGGNLSFDLDGASPNRLHPFFKIRNWRSLAAAGQVTLEAANLESGIDYTAAVKPFSRAYSCSDAACSTSTQRANGGLVGASEYLADRTAPQNFTLDFSGTNHLYLGSDSQFHGLNVVLATAGSGAGLNLQWDYWNGGSWANLEATAGFNDQTAHFTGNGTISWDADPATWTKRTLVAGDSLPLFWVRASLAAGGYTTSPVEAVIKTDILLFQYCEDITADFETFTFYAPPPTAVELLSFAAEGVERGVDLSWRTGSELDNLGFHLHRSLSEMGPWTRITPSLIPGLGSSPEGASYSFRDTGLTDGVRYFYRLEDIDAHSGSTFHGPVSAVPGAAPPSDDEDAGGSDDAAGSEDEEPAAEDSISRTYGSPEEASFRVVSRTRRAMVVELRTPGFVATETPKGVHVSVPGFDQPTDPRAPDLPLKRVVLDAVVGRHARILRVKERRTLSYPGLTPAALGSPEIVTAPDGTVRPGRRAAALKGEGLLPPFAASIAGDAFIGEAKKIALEMSPLRYDATSDTLLLAQTLRVKIAFDRKATRSERGRGSRGRRRPRSVDAGAPRVLAHLHTLTKGLHAVSFETLFPQGHDALPLDSLRLSLQGQGVAFHVEPKGKTFGPGSVLFFHSSTEARSTDYSPEVAYALEQAPGGLTMPTVSASPRGNPALVSASLAEASFETNRSYQAGLLDAPDPWLWDFLLGGMSKSWPLAVEGVDSTSAAPAQLQVLLQGASEADTDGDHHLSVSWNGIPLGETTFD
ncbi:MAG: C25 family peptidase propeptide domain-containing protein, partial [Acidobacteriota bacterium]